MGVLLWYLGNNELWMLIVGIVFKRVLGSIWL